MDIKPDVFSIELDPALLISYGVGQLNLESVPSDIFEFPEEISENYNSDSGDAPFSESKLSELSDFKEKNALQYYTSSMTELKIKNHPRDEKQGKDINGNEEPSSCEHLNQLFDKLELSDSEIIKVEPLDSKNIKAELSDFEIVKAEPSDLEDINIELSDFENIKVELSDSENIKAEPPDSENLKVTSSGLGNIKVEPSDLKNVKAQLFDLKNIKAELSDSENIKVRLSDSKNIKAGPSDFEIIKVEPSDLENIKVEPSDSKNIKAELSDLEDIKVEFSDSENIKTELSDSDNDKVELSDSDNEEADGDPSKLQERGPVKTQSRSRKNRGQNNILSRNRKNPDKSQFNLQTLKFLSGSSQVEFNEPNSSNKVFHSNLASLFIGSDCTPPPIQDYFYGDLRAKAVSSPESGYESSSAQSRSSSPPLLPLSGSYSLDFIPESVDEQNILEFLVENTTDCALSDNNLPVRDMDGKDAKGKIIEIINYLKDIPDEINESCYTKTSSNDIHEFVPLVSKTEDLNISSPSVPPSPVLKNTETPKKLVYKLNDKAKKKLREFLSMDAFYAAKARIYKKINEMANGKHIKVIYVEDETDKASENRTNLHHAVLDSRIEDIYCLVEIHKQYNKPLTDINIRDKFGKTALDYAIHNKMTLVVDYLKENTACQSVNI